MSLIRPKHLVNKYLSAIPGSYNRAILALSAITLISKILGFVEKIVVAHFFGTSRSADVYFASTTIILSLVFFVKELIYPSLLPILAESLQISNQLTAALIKKILITASLILIPITICIIIFPSAITSVLTPGFDQSKKLLTANMIKHLSPAFIFLCLSTITFTVLNAQKLFIKAALPNTLQKLLLLAGLIILVPSLGFFAIPPIITIAAAAVFITQLCLIPQTPLMLRTPASLADHQFKKMIKLMSPLIIGVLFSHVSSLIDNLLASTLPQGNLASLAYAKKIIDAVVLIGPVAIVTVTYSSLAQIPLKENPALFKKLFTKKLCLLTCAAVPVSIFLILFSDPIVKIMFQRGQFHADSTITTARSLAVYSTGLLTFSLESLIVFAFYAAKDTKTPVIFGILTVIINIVFTIALIKPIGCLAIPAAMVISKSIKVIILSVILKKRLTIRKT